MTEEKDSQNNTGRVTTQEFYTALLAVKEDIGEMERRILARIEFISTNASEIQNLKDKQKELREDIHGACEDIDEINNKIYDIKKRENIWDGVNSILIVLAGVAGTIFGVRNP
jgi:uncharacterized coiled-coil DUF342 family protein